MEFKNMLCDYCYVGRIKNGVCQRCGKQKNPNNEELKKTDLWLYARLWFMDKVKKLLDKLVGTGW